MRTILSRALAELNAHRSVVLVTIVAEQGSAPRGPGSQMLVGADGQLTGTIGGGQVERQSELLALSLLKERRSQIQHFALTQAGADSLGMACGGDVTVLFQFISPEDILWQSVLETALDRLTAAQPGWRDPEFARDPLSANLRALAFHIRRAKEISNGGIIGVNIMCALTHYEEYVRCCIENGADLIISGAGLPTDLPKYTAGSSIKLAPIVSPPRTAKVLLKLWDNHYHRVPDLVVIEGPAAGGHLGYSAETVEETARRGYDDEIREILQIVHGYEEKYACTIPVVFAGGVYTHEDILHYLSLGCAGVQMATRFVVTEECDADPRYKQAYLNAKKEDITIMHSPVGMPGRAIRNPFLTEREQEREKISHCYQCLKKCDKASIPYCITTALTRAADGDTDNALLFCGENAWRLDHMTTVPELMAELAGESLPDSKKQKI